MISEHEARRYVLDRCPVGEVIDASIAEAVGAVLAEPVVAREDVPPFANSAVDGYAVRAADVAGTPARLRVVAEVAAGWSTDRVVGPGEAIRIMTGAPMPAGADASVMVEDTERDDDEVVINRSVAPGASVRGVGDDVHIGTEIFAAGTVVRPAVAGVLASINANRVRVYRKARVAVLSTGDELISDGSALRPGQIRESNKAMLLPLVADTGCEAVNLGVVRDDEAELEALLRDAAVSYDAIITSGGVSMGEYDVVKAVLSRIADMRWMQIAIKPAKPFAFGVLAAGDRSTPVFGLPGNPVSSMVSFELFRAPGAAQDDGSYRARPHHGLGDRRRRPASPRPTERPTTCGFPVRSNPMAGTTSAPWAPRAAISWPRPRWPMPWPSFPTATVFRRAAPSRSCCCR